METKGKSLKSVTAPLKWLESERDKKGESEGEGEGKRKGGS